MALPSQEEYQNYPLVVVDRGRDSSTGPRTGPGSNSAEKLGGEAADKDSKDCSGKTPLHWATREGHEAIARLLVEKGAKVEHPGWRYAGDGISFLRS